MSKTRPAPKPARPTGGGSFVRDRRTGALTRVSVPADSAAPAAPAPTSEEEA